MTHDRQPSLAAAFPTDADIRDLVLSANLSLSFIDPDGIILWANRADCELLDYRPEAYIGRNVAEFHDDPHLVRALLERLADGEAISQHPARLRCRDGSLLDVEITASARFADADGQRRFLHARCLTQDVSGRRRTEQTRDLLVRASQTLSQSLDLHETLAALSDLVVPQFADWYAVHLVDEAGNVVPAHIAHVDPERTRLAWQALGSSPDSLEGPSAPAMAVRTGRALLAPRVDTALLSQVARSDHHRALLQAAGIRSAMVIPLKLDRQTIGAMTFVSTQPQRSYREEEVPIAEALAERAALALSNARLHRQVAEARETAETAARRLDVLLTASGSIASSLEPDEALVRLAECATRILADYCVTYRLEADGQILRIGLAHADPAKQSLVETLVRAGPPSLRDAHGVGAVICTGQPVLAPDISADYLESAAQNGEHLDVLRQLSPRSSIIVPLKARGRTLGGAAFVTTELSDRRYDEADLSLANDLAGRVALLIDNARLYEEAQAANQAMEDMLSVVAHDLRNPLNTIVTAGSLLDLPLAEDERRNTTLTISRAADRMKRLLNDLLDVTRIGQHRLSMTMEPTDVTALSRETVSMHVAVAQSRGIRLRETSPETPVTVVADPARLVQALSNLLDNALKFAPDGGEVTVRVVRKEAATHLAVSDSGPGIAPADLPHLFDRFWRAAGGRDGMGLGLTIAKGIAEGHDGCIEVNASPGEGATFTIVLPNTPSGG